MSFYDGLAFVGDTMNQSETEGGSGHRRRGPDYPGERPSKADREKWVREWPRCLNPEQKTVLRGGVPAKLAAETAEFEMTDLPALAHKGHPVPPARRRSRIGKPRVQPECLRTE